jgi:crotonobetainyl-CoA:carnitine CoA-transferase CaiB-like acyl-CoA transferase
MLSTVAHALADTSVVPPTGAVTPAPDPQLFGLGPLHRLYETADHWVMCTVERPDARAGLAAALGVDLDDPELADALAAVFLTSTAREWQDRLLAAGITVVAVSPHGMDKTFVTGTIPDELGIRTQARHATLDEYPRLTELVRFSRSRSVLGEAPLCGQHTDAVLAELASGDSA